MADYTKNYHLKKPLPEEFYDVADQNGNMDLIDAQIKRNAEDIQKIMEKGAGGIPPQIIITSKNGSTVTCTKDETTLEQISSGTVTFDLDSYGTWHVTATSDGVPIETDVLVDDVKQYKISLIGIVATVHVTTSSGAVVTATNGTLTLGGLGSTSFELLQSGDWVFTAKLDDTVVSAPLVVEVGNTYQVDLRMLEEIKLISKPDKTEYLTNEQFDKTGLVVSAVFKDGTVEDVTDRCGFSPNVMTFDTSIVTVTFGLNGISKTVEIPVTVSKRQGTIKLNTEELNLSESVRTGTIVVDTQNTGDIVATSSDISVATVTVIEKTVTVTLVNPGVTTISVYAKEDNTYLQTNSAKCTVTVAKYTGTISVSPTSLSLTASAKTKNITVTTNSTGTVIAKSNNSSIATVSVSGKTVKVTGVKSGSTSISIYVTEDETYVQTITKTISINVQLLPEKRPLEEMSWADIRRVSDAGLASEYWSVGDTKTIILNGTVAGTTFNNTEVQVVIIGFDHNATREGAKRIHFQIGRIGIYNVALNPYNYSEETAEGFCMNIEPNRSGGWKSSHMRNNILGNTSNPTSPKSGTLLAILPADLRAVMKSVTKYTDNVGNHAPDYYPAANITTTTDYLFLLTEQETFGSSRFSNHSESGFQKQYDGYIANNWMRRRPHNRTDKNDIWWWLRSPSYYSNEFTCNPGGNYINTSSGKSNRSYGIAPGFCV